jgi:hypothetical protein
MVCVVIIIWIFLYCGLFSFDYSECFIILLYLIQKGETSCSNHLEIVT